VPDCEAPDGLPGGACFLFSAVAFCPLASPKAAVVVARRTQLWLDEEAPPPSLACLMLMRFVIAASCSFQTRGLTNISAPAVSLLDLDRNTAHMHEPALVLNFSSGENI
jgi:hypothetical protein